MNTAEKLEGFNDYGFDFESSIILSKKILENKLAQNRRDFKFEDNHWPLFLVLKQRFTHIKFNELVDSCNKLGMTLLNNSDNLNVFKCWCTSLLDIFEPETLRIYIRCFRGFVEITEGLKEFNFDKIFPKYNVLPKYIKSGIYPSIMNLMDYYPDFFEVEEKEIVLLLEQLNLLSSNEKNSVREIPSTTDFLILDKVVQDFFSKNLTGSQYLKWSCIELWWKLTTIIPMRISEFCILEKKSLIIEDSKYYINIKRVKTGTTRDYYTKVAIPKEYYFKFIDYIEAQANLDRNCNTIFSRKIIREFIYGNNKKIMFHEFSSLFFRKLLNAFYREIVCEKYGYSEYFNIEKQVFPNDTRHLAFINLKLQGIHPVIVARIGGHTKLQTQEHYFHHIKNMMDLELLALFTSYRMDNFNFIDKTFIEEYVIKPNETNFKRPMKIGYCTDPNMKCLVSNCWQGCSSWRIEIEELRKNKEFILEQMDLEQKNLRRQLETLNILFNDIVKITTQKDSNSRMIEETRTLENKSNSIFEALENCLTLRGLFKRIDNSEKAIRINDN